MGSQKLVLSIALTLSSFAFGEQMTLRKIEMKPSRFINTPITDKSVGVLKPWILLLKFEGAGAKVDLGKFEVGKKEISCSATANSAGTKNFVGKSTQIVRLAEPFKEGGEVQLNLIGAGKRESDQLRLTCTSRELAAASKQTKPLTVQDLQGYFDARLGNEVGLALEELGRSEAMESMHTYTGPKRKILEGSADRSLLNEATRVQECVNPNKPSKLSDELLQRCTADKAVGSDILGNR